MSTIIFCKEGWRMLRRARHVARHGWRRYPGAAEDICSAIVHDCYDRQEGYFRTSCGHFTDFYCRDFGMCVESLLRLGYKKEVLSTLAYALERFAAAGKITTTISPEGIPFDFITLGPDSLAFLVHALHVSNARQLIKKHKTFLNKEIHRYYTILVDPASGLVRDKLFVSSIKDSASRSSSCYDTCMLGMLARELDALRLENPFSQHDYCKLVMTYWNGSSFSEDTRKLPVITGDANTFPFWCGIITDAAIARKTISAVQQEGLDKPLALKYTKQEKSKQTWIYTRFFAPNYEGNTVWCHLGLCYLDVLKQYAHREFAKQRKKYLAKVEENGNFLELFNADGTPYATFFYHADEGMLWAAKLLK